MAANVRGMGIGGLRELNCRNTLPVKELVF